MNNTVKWGIVAPGRIAHKFAEAAQGLEGHEVTAVASRNPDRSREFASRWNIPAALDSYEVLYSRSDVEAVYIASPHRFHKEQIRDALEAGKHVLCEKPVCVNAE